MTADRFRDLALSLPETSESAHMNHPDFRVGGKYRIDMQDESCEHHVAVGEYQEIVPLRQKGADGTVVIAEGV